MSCPDRDRLWEYLDGELPPRAFREVEKQIEKDEACRLELADVMLEDDFLRDGFTKPVDGSALAREVLRRLSEGDLPEELPPEA